MRCPPSLALLLLLPACGGGGGTVVPVTTQVRLEAAPLDLGANVSAAELAVALPTDVGAAAVLVRVAVELPPALALAATDRLAAATTLPDLDGELQDGRFVVLCGDARNAGAAPLPKGELFRLRLVTATPRQTGTFEVRLTELQAAAADGTPLPVATTPTVVPVRIR